VELTREPDGLLPIRSLADHLGIGIALEDAAN
jgi:hypothetical protein